MAIKLNGVEITSNRLNSSNVTLENLDGSKVWPIVVIGNEWVYVFTSSSSNDPVPGQTGTAITMAGVFDGDISNMLDEMMYYYPPNNYDVGQVIIVLDYDTSYYYYFQRG